MKTFKELYEDIEVTDRTGKALDFAQQYVKTYKTTKRPVPEIIKKSKDKFILKGKDEKLVADMLSDKSIRALSKINVKTRKVK
tara:strand:+ start:80 stop:328 length:249 start_codon:yes stop_codon:yes gene_type:complete